MESVNPVGAYDDPALHVTRPRGFIVWIKALPREASLVGIEDRDERYLRQWSALTEQVDADNARSPSDPP